jgi:hypothetical protein
LNEDEAGTEEEGEDITEDVTDNSEETKDD